VSTGVIPIVADGMVVDVGQEENFGGTEVNGEYCNGPRCCWLEGPAPTVSVPVRAGDSCCSRSIVGGARFAKLGNVYTHPCSEAGSGIFIGAIRLEGSRCNKLTQLPVNGFQPSFCVDGAEGDPEHRPDPPDVEVELSARPLHSLMCPPMGIRIGSGVIFLSEAGAESSTSCWS
jgi:hypothetical protein